MSDLSARLDREESAVNAATVLYIGPISRRIGALVDTNPTAYAGLKESAEKVQAALILWRQSYRRVVKAGYPADPTAALLTAGATLRRTVSDLNVQSKKATPGVLVSLVSNAATVAVSVAGDIAKGTASLGEAVIDAGRSSLGVIRWAPWLAVAAAVLYFVAPKILAEAIKGFSEGRKRAAAG